MKKCLLRTFAVLAMTIGSSVVTWADNVVYGLIPSYSFGARSASLNLDNVNTSAVTTLAPDFTFEGATEVKCGTTAGDKYYAFVSILDPDTYEETVALATLNFTTGEMVVVNNFSYGYSKPGYNASGMTYDEKNDVLYAMEISFNDNDEYVTNLYSVNQTDGSMEQVASFLGAYHAIASDHNGGFYLVENVTDNTKSYPNLYKVSSTFEVTPYISNSSLSAGWSSYNSLAVAEDGKTAYLVESKKVIAFDLGEKTVSLKGELTDNLAAISYGKSSANGTPADPPASSKKNTRFLIEKVTYGSSMGDIPVDTDSKREYFYYNTDGKMVGSASYGREYAETGGVSDKFSPLNITKTRFDENGNMAGKDSYQWGAYDFDDYAWKKTYNSESYVYDENGKLTSDSTSYSYNVYTYNEDGTLATKSTYTKRTKTLTQQITYSNYDENGNAWHYSSTGAYDSYKYEAELAYDENGNKVQEFQYNQVEDPEFPGETMNKMKQIEMWEYDNNILKLYTKNLFDEQQNEVPYMKTEYKPVDGNVNEIQVCDSTYSGGVWYANNLPQKYVYGDFSDMAEMTTMEFMAEKDPELVNTVDILFTVPQLAYSQNCNVVIYRDCVPVDTVSIYDVYDDMEGLCKYQDKGVKNGNYSYFLQPVFSANSEFGPMDDMDNMGNTGVEETEWVGYYSTNPMDVKLETKLPAVTDLALAGGKIETTGNIMNMVKTYYADLSWKNPEDMDKYGFVKNSIYFVGAGVAELDTTDVAANKATVMLYDEDVEAYVVTKYQLGRAISDTITIRLKDIEGCTAIETAAADGTVDVRFNGNVVTLGNNANVTVFSTNGQKVYAEDNAESISLDRLPASTYIICVEKNGKVSAYKYKVK